MTDFRFDPFEEKFLPTFRTGELYTAKTFSELNNRTGFFLRELPQRRIPSTVNIIGADLAPLAEVSRSTPPGVTEFRVDYSQLFFWSSGFVEVHASRAGEQFSAAYHSLGAGLNASHRADAKFTFNRGVTTTRDTVARSFSAGGLFAVHGLPTVGTARLRAVADAEAETDLVSLGFMNEFTATA